MVEKRILQAMVMAPHRFHHFDRKEVENRLKRQAVVLIAEKMLEDGLVQFESSEEVHLDATAIRASVSVLTVEEIRELYWKAEQFDKILSNKFIE
jgi:hypothetical protein